MYVLESFVVFFIERISKLRFFVFLSKRYHFFDFYKERVSLEEYQNENYLNSGLVPYSNKNCFKLTVDFFLVEISELMWTILWIFSVAK